MSWAVIAALLAAGGVTALVARYDRRLFRSRSPRAIAVVTAAASVGALWASGAPTGQTVADHLYRAAFAALVTLAASRSRRWAWLVGSGVALVAGLGSWADALAGAASGAAFACAVSGRRGRVVGALIGAADAQVLLRLRHPHWSGATAALAAAVFLLFGVSYLRRSRSRERKRIFLGGAAALIAFVVAGGISALAAASVASRAQRALAVAETGLSAAQQGHAEQADSAFAQASSSLSYVHGRVGSWWASAGRLVPGVGPNVRAIDVLAGRGTAVLAEGRALVRSANIRDVGMQNGTVDLTRLEGLHPAVVSSQRAVQSAAGALDSVRSPWLVPALRDRMTKLQAKLATVGAEENTLSLATEVLPGIFGSNSRRRWMLAVLDNSELRGAGGLMAAWGTITADDGHVHLESLDPVNDQHPPPGIHLVAPPDYISRYGAFDPADSVADVFYSPDFPTDAQVAAQLYPQWGRGQVDGVIGIDAFGLADLLQLTGPLAVPGWPSPISASNAVPVILHDEYTALSGDARQQFLAELGHRVFDQLTASLPGPDQLESALGSALRGRHLQLYSNDPREQELFGSIGATGSLPPVTTDFLDVVTQDASEAKIDWYLKRSTAYAVKYDPSSGSVVADLALTLTNGAPSSGQPDYVIGPGQSGRTSAGVNRIWVSVYSELSLAAATVNGAPLQMKTETELGRNVYSAFVTVPPGGSALLNLGFHGHEQWGTYRLDLPRQPAPNPDSFLLTYQRGSQGASPLYNGTFDQDEVIRSR